MRFLNAKAAALTAIAVSLAAAADLAPSTSKPVSNPPQFIVLGSDDNTDPAALNWMVGVLKKYSNKNDKSPLRMSFYSNTASWKTNTDPIVAAHTAAYKSGHEVSNHTKSHIYCVTKTTRLSKEAIKKEIDDASAALKDLAGIPKEHQFGFRTPYLAYSDSTFSAAQESGYLYDCSVNGGTTWGQTPGKYYWPYTLNTNDGEGNYSPDNTAKYNTWNKGGVNKIRQHSGMWELPAQMFLANPQDTAYMSTVIAWDHGGKITGLDYNLWAESKFNKDQSLRALKNTLDSNLAGNRSPMTVGVHSQYYFKSDELATDDAGTPIPGKYAYPNMRASADRQWMFEEFIKYAVTKNDVWFVSGDMVVRFMQKPVSASAFKPADYAVIAIDGGVVTENVKPTDIALSASSVEIGTAVVGTLTTIDPNTGDTHKYSLTSGGDKFEIIGNSLKLKAGTAVGSYTVKVKSEDQGGLFFEKDFTVKVTEKAVVGSFYEVIGAHEWAVDKDALGSAGEVTGKGPVVFALTKAADKGTDYAYVSAGAELDTTFDKVTQISVDYTADQDAVIGLSGTTVVDGKSYGYGFSAVLPKDSKVKDLKPTDFTFAWKVDSLKTEPKLNMSEISGISIEAGEFVGKTTVTVSSVKLYGYVKPTGTVVNDEFIDLLDAKYSLYTSYDTANGAVGTVKMDKGAAVVDMNLGDKGTYAGLGSWVKDDFNYSAVKQIEITYTSTAPFTLSLPMTGVTDGDGSAHNIPLPAGTKTIRTGVLSFAQPEWVAADKQTKIDLSKVESLDLALADEIKSGKITITSFKLYLTGDATPITADVRSSAASLSVNGISGSVLSLSVPAAGSYTVSLFGLNGQKLGTQSANLSAGSGTVNLAGMNLGQRMVIVQISGAKAQSVHKVVIK